MTIRNLETLEMFDKYPELEITEFDLDDLQLDWEADNLMLKEADVKFLRAVERDLHN